MNRVTSENVVGVVRGRDPKLSKEYVALSVAAPEFGARTLYANLGRAAGQSDENIYALIWNPQD